MIPAPNHIDAELDGIRRRIGPMVFNAAVIAIIVAPAVASVVAATVADPAADPIVRAWDGEPSRIIVAVMSVIPAILAGLLAAMAGLFCAGVLRGPWAVRVAPALFISAAMAWGAASLTERQIADGGHRAREVAALLRGPRDAWRIDAPSDGRRIVLVRITPEPVMIAGAAVSLPPEEVAWMDTDTIRRLASVPELAATGFGRATVASATVDHATTHAEHP